MLEILKNIGPIKSKAPKVPYILYVTIQVSKPMALNFKGWEENEKNTVYFDRQFGEDKPFQGVKTFEFPLAIVPKSLRFSVRNLKTGNAQGIKILKHWYKPLNSLDVNTLSNEEKEFVDFALDFSRQVGNIPPSAAPYTSDNGQYKIFVYEKLRAKDDEPIQGLVKGQVLNTSARMNHETGEMEIAKPVFDKMTVVNRFMILCHEYCHYANDTRDEFECDRYAAKMALDMGFSQTECLYALANLFMDNDKKDMHPRQIKEQEDRVEACANFIISYKQKDN